MGCVSSVMGAHRPPGVAVAVVAAGDPSRGRAGGRGRIGGPAVVPPARRRRRDPLDARQPCDRALPARFVRPRCRPRRQCRVRALHAPRRSPRRGGGRRLPRPSAARGSRRPTRRADGALRHGRDGDAAGDRRRRGPGTSRPDPAQAPGRAGTACPGGARNRRRTRGGNRRVWRAAPR